MITVEHLVDGHRANVFLARADLIPSTEELAKQQYWDAEDQARERHLRAILQQDNVRALAFPTLGHEDVLQVFLLQPDEEERVFACALVTRARLRDMLEASAVIVESFTLQVTSGEHLTTEAVRAAVQAWVERVVPADGKVPALTVDYWTGESGVPVDLLRLLMRSPAAVSLEPGASDVQPDPGLAQPAYEEAA